VHQDVQQNLDEQNLDVNRPFLVAVRHFLVHQQDVVVDAVLRHQLKMDYCLDVVGVELRHQLKMDCCQVVVRVQMVLAKQVLEFQRFQLHALQPHALQPLPYWQST
jgi:hypothetical protein